jgi:Na+/melibiose symporter-like transporter
MKWIILVIVVALCIWAMVAFFVSDNVAGFAAALGILIVFSAIWLTIHFLTTRYLKSSKEDAYRLLKSEKPNTKQIQETIKDLGRFPQDQEVKKLIEELTKRRIDAR